MRLTCSACGAHGSIEQFTADADARTAMAIALRLPTGVGAVALRYIALFRPAKRGLTWDRVCKLLGELAQMIEAGAVERRGHTHPASHALFLRAMEQMVVQRERLRLPLKDHNYLREIIAGDSPRESAALEAQAEAAKAADSRRRAVPEETPFERSLRLRQAQDAAKAGQAQGDAAALLSGALKRVDV